VDAWLPLNDMTDGREWPVVWLSLALSLVIYVALAIALARFIPGPDSPAGQLAAAEAAAEFLPGPEMAKNIRPEPLEKARYLLGLLCIPTLPTAFYLLGRRFMSRRWLDLLNGPGVLAARDLLFLAALLAWFITILRSSALPHAEGYLLVSFLLALVIVFRWRGSSQDVTDHELVRDRFARHPRIPDTVRRRELALSLSQPLAPSRHPAGGGEPSGPRQDRARRHDQPIRPALSLRDRRRPGAVRREHDGHDCGVRHARAAAVGARVSGSGEAARYDALLESGLCRHVCRVGCAHAGQCAFQLGRQPVLRQHSQGY
jgi:hypothetical protein